ncbi:hypothetical protein D3C81_1564920 [compost metagenome]
MRGLAKHTFNRRQRLFNKVGVVCLSTTAIEDIDGLLVRFVVRANLIQSVQAVAMQPALFFSHQLGKFQSQRLSGCDPLTAKSRSGIEQSHAAREFTVCCQRNIATVAVDRRRVLGNE